ncbi:hypothetical protein EDC04DRAFT_2894437 [Pisolithus marmoratus]|nr:hypothetical protein EDC04DRAFT_2894437 [Pisolithus marmoratus]
MSADLAPAIATAHDMSLGLAMSLNEVLGLVPTDFRECLWPHFQRIAEIAEKRSNMHSTLDKLRWHKANGTLPPQLSGSHMPVFQFTKEFMVKAGDPTGPLKVLHDSFVIETLNKIIEIKTAEVAHLDSVLKLELVVPELITIMGNEAKKLEPANQVPVFTNRTTDIHHWELSRVFIAMRDQFLNDLAPFVACVLALDHAKTVTKQSKTEA